MNFDLSEEIQGIRETVRLFAQKEIVPVPGRRGLTGTW